MLKLKSKFWCRIISTPLLSWCAWILKYVSACTTPLSKIWLQFLLILLLHSFAICDLSLVIFFQFQLVNQIFCLYFYNLCFHWLTNFIFCNFNWPNKAVWVWSIITSAIPELRLESINKHFKGKLIPTQPVMTYLNNN